jgi:hypothetical protein
MKKPATVPARNLLRRRIDAFLDAPKTLDGIARWTKGTGHGDVRAAWPILVGTSTEGEGTLQITAYPNERRPRFTIGVFWPDCIWRLDHELIETKHRNPLPQNPLNARHQIIAGPHVHAWVDNRPFIKGTRVIELPFAVPYTGTAKWPAALRWACGETKVKMRKEQMLDWPQRTTLL